MSAQVETLMFHGVVPWHNEGTRVNDADIFDIAKGIKSAGLDWTVGLKPLQTTDGIPVKHRACYRQSDGRILGVVGPRWTPVQNWEMFAWFQPWLDAKVCSLHTAGSLCQGEKVWVLCQITDNPLMEIVKGDDVAKFILLANSHDGTMAVRAGFTPIRVVCANTMAAAISNASSKLIRIRHSARVVDNLHAIRDIMDLANQEFNATAEQYRFLASKQINSADLRKYVKIVMGVETIADPDMSTRMKNILDEVILMTVKGKGQDNPNVRGTYWGAYNGVNEYLNYIQGRNASNRLDGLWFGQGATMNQKALNVATVMAGGNASILDNAIASTAL